MNNKQLIKSILKLTRGYDFAYVTSDLRGFYKKNFFIDSDIFNHTIVNAMTQNNLTVLIPTYTYSNKGNFVVEKTKSNLSVLTKWILKQKNIKRSEHPLFSIASIGNKKKIVEKIGKSAFGKDSVFDRLYNNKSCLLHIGRPLELGNTSIHYVEQLCGANYRVHKLFKTKVYKQNKFYGTNFSSFVRNTKISTDSKTYKSNTIKIGKKLKKTNIVKEVGNYKNLTNITFLDYSKAIDFMVSAFYKDHNIFIN